MRSLLHNIFKNIDKLCGVVDCNYINTCKYKGCHCCNECSRNKNHSRDYFRQKDPYKITERK